MKVENRYLRIGIDNLLIFVGEILGYQVLASEAGFGLRDGLCDMRLPFECDATEVRLVADLIIQVIEIFQLLYYSAHHRILYGQQIGILKRISLGAFHGADAVNVVGSVHRA